MQGFLTVQEVAAVFNRNSETVRRWIRSGDLAAKRDPVTKQVYVPRSAVDALMARMRDWTPQPERHPGRRSQSSQDVKRGDEPPAASPAPLPPPPPPPPAGSDRKPIPPVPPAQVSSGGGPSPKVTPMVAKKKADVKAKAATEPKKEEPPKEAKAKAAAEPEEEDDFFGKDDTDEWFG